ncbi:MAG TPA: biopolymer transporter ExbD, partial [Thermoanaerobaculia bacterium]|nr:biopolymer transporter ExbD [Thermoanaerobaculia bacterium]
PKALLGALLCHGGVSFLAGFTGGLGRPEGYAAFMSFPHFLRVPLVPVIQAGVPVDLPKASNVPALTAEETQLTVSIQADGGVYVRDVRVADSDLRSFLAAIQSGEPDKQVIVRGDQRLQYGKVAEVLAILRDVGYTRMGLILEKAR